MNRSQVFNERPQRIHDRQFSEKIRSPDEPIELYEDDESRIVLEPDFTHLRVPITQYLRHFPGLPHKKLLHLDDIVDELGDRPADIEQTTRYSLHRDFGKGRRSPHEFVPQTDQASNVSDAGKYIWLADQFDELLDLKGSVWQAHIYNTIKQESYLAATQFNIIEHHKNYQDKPINPGKKTTHTYTRYLNVLPH